MSCVALSEKSGIELAGKSIVRSSKPTAAPVVALPPTCSSQRAMSGAALDTVTPASNAPGVQRHRRAGRRERVVGAVGDELRGDVGDGSAEVREQPGVERDLLRRPRQPPADVPPTANSQPPASPVSG